MLICIRLFVSDCLRSFLHACICISAFPGSYSQLGPSDAFPTRVKSLIIVRQSSLKWCACTENQVLPGLLPTSTDTSLEVAFSDHATLSPSLQQRQLLYMPTSHGAVQNNKGKQSKPILAAALQQSAQQGR